MPKQMHRKPLRMQTKKHQKNKSKKLRGWVLSQSLFCARIYNFPSHVPHTPCRAGQERMHVTPKPQYNPFSSACSTHFMPRRTGTDTRHSQTTIQPIHSARYTHSKPRRTGTDAGYSRAALFAQPALFWELLLRLTLNRQCFLL